ncbi:MAG: hypothetical protein ACI9R3_006494 [Verrucomicrobiales bacterium]|jgi:hypothetical protein
MPGLAETRERALEGRRKALYAAVSGNSIAAGSAEDQPVRDASRSPIPFAFGLLGICFCVGRLRAPLKGSEMGRKGGDEIDDDWQVSFFGLANPDAAPSADPDGDEQNNLYEFLAHVDLTDSGSVFSSCLRRNLTDPTKRDVVLNPVFADRSYTLLASPDLNPSNFVPVAGTSSANNGSERVVTDI